MERRLIPRFHGMVCDERAELRSTTILNSRRRMVMRETETLAPAKLVKCAGAVWRCMSSTGRRYELVSCVSHSRLFEIWFRVQ